MAKEQLLMNLAKSGDGVLMEHKHLIKIVKEANTVIIPHKALLSVPLAIIVQELIHLLLNHLL